ncbi:MAG: tetratricopeptide repeat protein [Bacteroidota bacterium]
MTDQHNHLKPAVRFAFIAIIYSVSFFPGEHAIAQRAKTHTLTADEAKMVKKDANGAFTSGDFNSALASYKDLVKSAAENPEYNYRYGVCLLETNSIKSKAVEYLEKASKAPGTKKEVWYYLGTAYMNANRWDDAIAAFNTSKTNGVLKPSKDYLPVERMIEMCNNGKELVAHPIDVKFENMTKIFNTPFEEYNPMISADEKTLAFTSRRKGNMGGFIPELGVYTADIFSSMWRDTIWTKARSVGATVNSDWDEETIGMTHDGNQLLIYFDNMEFFGDLGISMLKGRNWQKPIMMSPTINGKTIENSACLSNDGQLLYFSSDKKDGQGMTDLWFCIRQTTGEWSTPQNMGPTINTKYDETDPYISLDGKTLYFCSKGHSSMGGFDIFYSSYDSGTAKWSEPKNLGYPINTAEDQISFSMTGNERYAYVGAVREGGLGDKDIYKITFNDTVTHPFRALIAGVVSSPNGAKVELRQVSLLSKPDKKVLSVYKPYFISNEYVLNAAPGEYFLKVEGYGFPVVEEEIKIEDAFPPADLTKNFSVEVAK